MGNANKVIQIALAEVGYQEKETNAELDHRTRNAGDENFTKYARDLDAINWLNENEPVNEAEIDWTPVEKEYERIHELRTRKVEGGKRPHEIRLMIQEAGDRGFDTYRPTAWMEEAIAELERIRKEEMPKQVCADDSVNFNTDWKAAIENINLLDSAEVSIKASLLREESRGSYLRPEFPGVDNENWNCMLTCRLVDGEMVFEKRDIPTLEA